MSKAQIDFFARGPRPPSQPTDTSEAAADSIVEHLGELQASVLACVERALHGMTCDEVEASLDLRHQTASARVRELVQKGLLVDSGKRRKARSGRSAIVWIAKGR